MYFFAVFILFKYCKYPLRAFAGYCFKFPVNIHELSLIFSEKSIEKNKNVYRFMETYIRFRENICWFLQSFTDRKRINPDWF